MWYINTLSSCCILYHCRIEHSLSEIPAQIFRCAHIHFPPSEYDRQFFLHIEKAEKARCFTRLKFNKNIHIAVRSKIITKNRTK